MLLFSILIALLIRQNSTESKYVELNDAEKELIQIYYFNFAMSPEQIAEYIGVPTKVITNFLNQYNK